MQSYSEKKIEWAERNKKIIQLHEEGRSFNELGKLYNITGQRVSMIYKKYAQKSTKQG